MEPKSKKNLWKKGVQHGKASWHRFLMDFGGFLEASWGRKSTKNRSKKASKKRWKNGRHQDGHKMRIGGSNASRPQGSRALGSPPLKAGQTPVRQEASRFGTPWLSWLLKSSIKYSTVLEGPLKSSKVQ